jgi:hypothetical protein
MNDLTIHALGARRIRWRYDDPSGLPDLPARTIRAGGFPVHPAGEHRVRALRPLNPKAA